MSRLPLLDLAAIPEEYHYLFPEEFSPGGIVALGLLVDFYVGLSNYIAAVDLPFEGGEFVGWTPDEETVSERFGQGWTR